MFKHIKFKRETLLGLLFIVLLGLILAACSDQETEGSTESASSSDDWPARDIRVIVPVAAGGGTDGSFRQLQPYLEKELGVNFVVEHHPGGSTIAGTQVMLDDTDSADGYTIGVATYPHYEFGATALQSEYDWEDVIPLGTHSFEPASIWIHKDEDRFDSFDSMIEWARENPGELTFSVSSITSDNYLGLKLIEEVADVEFNIVSFDGGNPARLALAARDVDATNAGVFAVQSIIDSVKPVAIQFDERAFPELQGEDTPLVDDLLGEKTINVGGYYGIFLPAEFKEKHPERFAKFQESYKNAVQNEDYIEDIEELKPAVSGEIQWFDHDESFKRSKETNENVERYLHLFQ